MTTVIIGATGSVGEALARRLKARGQELFLAARDRDRLRRLATELDAYCIVLDATHANAIEHLFDKAQSECGGIRGAVYCAGSLVLKPAHLTSDEDFTQTLSVNLLGPFYMLREAAKRMMTTGGSIVLPSSAAALTGMANHEAIAAAKAGVVGLVRAAAASYAQRGIRINAYAPGMVESALTESLLASESTRQASMAMHPMKRLGQPDDVASLIDWLLADENDWVTGQVFNIDGGLANLRPKPMSLVRK